MLIDVLLVSVGLAILLTGAWLTVRAASILASSFGISPLIIGATVVAFGTSAPELVVSLTAAIEGAPGIAVGNALGSNVVNVGLVLGVSAAIRPLAVHRRLLRWDIPVLAGATFVILIFAADGTVSRWEGALMLGGLVAFLVFSARLFSDVDQDIRAASDAGTAGGHSSEWRLRVKESMFLLFGLAAVTVGSDVGVRGAVGLAEAAGISETAIGVTIVATGTSLPELATSAVAAYRRENEIAVANVVGSNIFNLLGVLGLIGALMTLEVDKSLYQFELPALALSTALLLPLVWPGYSIGRIKGLLALACYCAFLVIVLYRG